LDQFESIKTSTEKEEQKSFLEKLSSDIVSQFIATEEFKFEQTVPEQTRTIQRVQDDVSFRHESKKFTAIID
jgi:hypothetical protein